MYRFKGRKYQTKNGSLSYFRQKLYDLCDTLKRKDRMLPQAIHPETCLRKWYETQEIHGLTHTCSLCRAQLHLICQKICPTDLCKTKKVRIYYGGEQQPAACTLETVNGMKP